MNEEFIQQYRLFVQQMLMRAGISEQYRELLTDEQGMKLFLIAITHPTVDPVNNYQELEFIGDGILKGILGQYIVRRFPNLPTTTTKKGTKEGILTKIRRSLEQEKTLGQIGLKLGFWDYIICDEEVKATNRNKILEDAYEAFIGAMVEIIDEKVKKGLGYMYAYNFVASSLNERQIDISSKALDTAITRLFELYKTDYIKNGLPPLKWGDALYKTQLIHIPIYKNKQDIPRQASIGDLIVGERDILVYGPKGWSNVINLKTPLNYNKYIFPVEKITEEFKEKNLGVWYVGVYGYFDKNGQPI
jgi:dsRNA-specific ribonuclease